MKQYYDLYEMRERLISAIRHLVENNADNEGRVMFEESCETPLNVICNSAFGNYDINVTGLYLNGAVYLIDDENEAAGEDLYDVVSLEALENIYEALTDTLGIE